MAATEDASQQLPYDVTNSSEPGSPNRSVRCPVPSCPEALAAAKRPSWFCPPAPLVKSPAVKTEAQKRREQGGEKTHPLFRDSSLLVSRPDTYVFLHQHEGWEAALSGQSLDPSPRHLFSGCCVNSRRSSCWPGTQPGPLQKGLRLPPRQRPLLEHKSSWSSLPPPPPSCEPPEGGAPRPWPTHLTGYHLPPPLYFSDPSPSSSGVTWASPLSHDVTRTPPLAPLPLSNGAVFKSFLYARPAVLLAVGWGSAATGPQEHVPGHRSVRKDTEQWRGREKEGEGRLRVMSVETSWGSPTPWGAMME